MRGVLLPQPIVALDIETTGLNETEHEVYEFAGIQVSALGRLPRVLHVSIPVDWNHADPIALAMFQARPHNTPLPRSVSPHVAAQQIRAFTAGAVVVGNNPACDHTFLTQLMRREGIPGEWHFYQMVDLENQIAGHFDLGPPPWNSTELSGLVGVDRAWFDSHTAIGDARWSLMQYEQLKNIDLGSHRLGSLGLSDLGKAALLGDRRMEVVQ